MFVGRKKELKILDDFVSCDNNRALLLYGKRRVGKTELLNHYFKYGEATKRFKYIYYECTRDTLDNNISSLCSVLVDAGIMKQKISFTGFDELFYFISDSEMPLCIVIDEYPYLSEFQPARKIDSQFQKAIDNSFSKNKLIVTGSNIAIMSALNNEKNALFARFDRIVKLEELNYLEASEFYSNKSLYEKIAFYSVFGGSPFINKSINSDLSLDENIENAFLDSTSSVYLYCQHVLFSDFSASININGICRILKNGKKSCSEIENLLSSQKNGSVNKKLDTLCQMMFLSKVQPINKKGNNKSTKYEIQDNAIRFFYTFVYDNKSLLAKINSRTFFDNYISEKLNTFISYRFEDICRQYFSILAKEGKLKGVQDIGTYYYDDPKSKSNGEFDVVLKLSNGKYRIIEAKYYSDNHKLTVKEMQEEERQIARIKNIDVDSFAFCCTSGYESTLEYECIKAEDLYDII